MADANARINIDINTSAAATGLRQLQSQITAFNSTLTKSSAAQATAMRNSTQNMLELVNASRFFTAETVKMQTAASSLDKTLSKGQVTLGQFLGAKFRKNSLAAAQVMSLAETRAQSLQTQFVATGAAANGMRDAIAIRPLQAFNNASVVSAQKLAIHRAMLQQATTSMINFGKNTQWAGRQLMVGFTVPLTIFAGVAGKTFRDLEREAVNFKKVYGDSFTPPEEMQANLDAVKELAKEYTKYGIAVKDTIALAAEAAAAGAQNKELIDATTQATRLATLGQMEQNEALDTTISLQNAFKLSGDELAKSINFLNMVENQTVVTLQDLSNAIPRVAPVIKGLGGDVEDLAAFLAAMQEGGVSAEQGANALKSGLASLINPTDKAKEKMDEFGISLNSIIQANRGDLMGTVQALADALDTLDSFSRQQAIEEIFGKFQYARLAALFDNINKDGTQAARVLEMTSMSAAEMAASAEKELGAIEEAVGTKFTAAMEKLQLAIAPIGEIFTKIAIPVINFFTSIIDRFNQLPDFAKTFSAFAAVIIGVVIPTGTMFLGLLMNLVGTLIKFGSLVGTAFKGFTSGGFKGAFDAVSQSLKYMSLAELDAVNSAQQLAGSTEAVNIAFRDQVTASDTAQAAVMELAYAYEILTQQMREAAIQNELVFGVGAAAMGAAGSRGPRVRRNRGGTIPGSGNTDTVPAMLTPGEFVVNKQATQNNLPLLKQINEGGKIPGYRLGGTVARIFSSLFTRKTPVTPIPSPMPIATGNARQQQLAQAQMGIAAPSLPVAGQQVRQQSTRFRSQQNLERTHLRESPKITSPDQLRSIQGYSPNDGKYAIAEELIRIGLPVDGMTGDWVALPRILNQAARRGSNIPMTSRQAADLLEQTEDVSFFFTNAKNETYKSVFPDLYPNVQEKEFSRRLAVRIRDIAEREGLLDQQITDALISRARDLEFPRLIDPNLTITGIRLPTKGDLARLTRTGLGPRSRGVEDAINEMFIRSGSPLRLNPPGVGRAGTTLTINGFEQKVAGTAGEFGTRIEMLNRGSIVPGQGNKDTVPAMLTPGEFVVNKQATQKNKPLLEAINSGKPLQMNMGGKVPGVQYFARNILQRVVQPLSSAKTIVNPQQQRHLERQLGVWLGGGMDKVNVRELQKLGLARTHGETELFRGMVLKPLSDRRARFAPEIHEAFYRYARSGNIDDLAGIIGKPIAIGARSFSKSKKATREFSETGNRDDASFTFKIKDERGIYGIDPYQQIGRKTQSSSFKENRKSYKKEKEIIPLGKPEKGRPDIVVGRIALDKDGMVVIDTGAKLSRKEIASVTKEYDSRLSSQFATKSQIRDAQDEFKIIQSQYQRLISKKQTASSKDAGNLYAKISNLRSKMSDGRLNSLRTKRDRRAVQSIVSNIDSMSDELTVIFNRARAAGLNNGGFISPTLKMNNGNMVPGMGSTDTVPAMLTPGEFVVNKKASQENLGLLHAINGGKVQFLNAGGMAGAMIGEGNTWFVDDGKGNLKEFDNSKDAKKYAKKAKKAFAKEQMKMNKQPSMMRGMGASMGLGMGGAGIMMLGQQMQSSAAQRGETSALGGAISTAGIGLSMASILPMIPGIMSPVGLAIAGVAAAAVGAGIALKAWRNGIDDAAKQAAEFGANLGVTANALNNVSSLMGQQTPAQRQTQLQLGISEEDIKNLSESTEFSNILTSEEGQQFISDLENATSAERFQKLSDYLRYAIASGIMDKSVAQSFAKGISAQIGDSVLGAQVSSAIRDQESGPEGIIDLGQKRIQEASSAISTVIDKNRTTYQESSKAIGAATQIIQDFANAEALAREQFASGTISYEELQSIVSQSTNIQDEYNQVISNAISKTNDFGATMQATMEQMVSSGLLTESQFKELEGIATSTRSSFDESAGDVVGQLSAADIEQARGEAPSGGIVDAAELQAAQLSALLSGMSFENVRSVSEEIASGQGRMFDVYQRGIESDAGGIRAFETAAATESIANMIGQGRSIPGVMDSSSALAEEVVIGFERGGGDPTALQSLIASLPEDGTARYDFLINFDLLTPEQQTQYISDSQKLAEMFGSEFANSLQESSQYQTALEKGSTGVFVSNMERAKKAFGESAQSMIDYSQKTNQPISQFIRFGEELSSLPDELLFRAGIDITNPDDLKQFGVMADELETAWPTLAQLPEGIDVRAFIEANTSENGQLKPIDKIVENVTKANKAMKDLDSTKPKVVKDAVINLMVMQGATPSDAESAFNEVISQMENFNKFDLESKSAIITLVTHRIDLQEKFDNAADALESMGKFKGGGGADLYTLSTTGQSIAEADKKIEAEVAAAQTKLNVSGSGTSGGGGGGGGTPEKTIAETIAEQRKLITNQEKFLMGGKGQKVAAGPFGQEFLEYLRSQGQKGVELMKKPFKEIEKIQKDFAVSQRKEIRIATMSMPDEVAKELRARKKKVEFEDKLVKEQNMSLDVATKISSALDSQQIIDYIRLSNQSNLNKSQQEYLSNLQKTIDETKKLVEYDKERERIEKYRAMTADERKSAGLSLSQQINDIQRQIAELEIIAPLQDQLDAQQKIADGINRTIELRQRDADVISRTIELEQRKIEPIDRAIEKYKEEQEQIEENYSAQLDALDAVAQKEEDNAKLRQSRLDLASAISRGDAASAAQIAIRMRNEQAANQRENTRAALERSRELEIEEIQERIKEKEEERKAIQEKINSLQLDQRKIQDDIYNLQQSLIPVNDEIFRINEDIRKEAEKLDDQYNNAKLQVQSLKQELKEAKLEAEALARASAAGGAAPSAPSGGLPPASSYESGSYQGATQSASVAAQFDQSILANAAKLNAAAAAGKDVTKLGFTKSDWQNLAELEKANKAAGLMYGGQAKKYAMGGMVNYKGSREPAPGFAMGGKIKKYAFGSFVPGMGMTDKVPAMLTPGEFVVRKSVAQQMMPHLQSFNSQVFPKMNMGRKMVSQANTGMQNLRDYVPRFDIPVIPSINSAPTNYSSSSEIKMPSVNNVQYTYNINVVAETNASPDDIANTVLRKMKLQDNSNVRRYNYRG